MIEPRNYPPQNFNPWHSVQMEPNGNVVLVIDDRRYVFPPSVANALGGELISASVYAMQNQQAPFGGLAQGRR